MCEVLEYMIYTSLAVDALMGMIFDLSSSDGSYSPLVSLLFYVTSCCIQIYGGNVYRIWMWLLAIASLLILVIYILGSLKFTNVDSYAMNLGADRGYFVGGMTSFLNILPLPYWFFVGIESLAFACGDLEHPKTIYKGWIPCMLTLFCTSIFVVIVTSSLPPGLFSLSLASVPLNAGFALMFNCKETLLAALSIPATYATAFGFMYSYGRLLKFLSLSNMVK